MAKSYDLTDKKVGKLTVIRVCTKEERPTQNHGHYWICQCECGNIVKVPTTYLTGNSNYTQTSCGCNRKKEAFQSTCGLNIENEYLERYNKSEEDFEKFLFIHKAITRTTHGKRVYNYNNEIDNYKKIIEYFWNDKQFNSLYNFWKNNEKNDKTFYNWAKPSLDHIIPVSRGGIEDISNYQFLTVFENLSKRDMTMEEWNNFKKETHTMSDYFIENIMTE